MSPVAKRRRTCSGLAVARGSGWEQAPRLPRPHQGQKALREGNRLRDLGRLGARLGDCFVSASLRCVGAAAACRPLGAALRAGTPAPPHAAGAAGGSVLGAEALGLPEPTSLAATRSSLPVSPPVLLLAERLRRGVAAGIRALGRDGKLVVESRASRDRCGVGVPKVALRRSCPAPCSDAAQGAAQWRAPSSLHHAGPGLLIRRLPAGLVWRGALLLRPGHVVGEAQARRMPHQGANRLLARRRIDGGEEMTRRDEHLLQGFPEILEQMEAIRDLVAVGAPWPAPSA